MAVYASSVGRNFWGSNAADTNGSRNIIGIKNAVIDLLIEKIILYSLFQFFIKRNHMLKYF
mgnify:CR=1 FL=1